MKNTKMSQGTQTTLVDIADLDCIFLTYDEPKKEEFWIRIKNMVPWAKRVDGVKGSDAAHKAAGRASDTDRFIIIDGDNIPDADFFNLQLSLDDTNRNCVFRWRARNAINGLMYGNGGLSCWTQDFVENMRTHEATDGSAANDVEFCFYPNYWAMHDCYSTTYPNQTPFQAWRAGFREGVKMCLDRGQRPSLDEFKARVHARNMDHLTIWQSVGADDANGFWAIYGARCGTYMTMLNHWDYTKVQDFDELQKLWATYQPHDADDCTAVGDILRRQLGLNIVDLDSEPSAFFKHHYKSNFTNKGIMTRE
jgi:hypothetical protein